MKSVKTIIPLEIRKEMAVDPFYQTCSLYGQKDHTCESRVTWEHAIIYAGKKIQKKWAIIPLCAKGHDVDEFQDGHNMVKEMNEWVALNRATTKDLEVYTKPDIMFNKVDYFREKSRLNDIYGPYIHKVPSPAFGNNFITFRSVSDELSALQTVAGKMGYSITSITTKKLNGENFLSGIHINPK